jgi:hypothetical protein
MAVIALKVTIHVVLGKLLLRICICHKKVCVQFIKHMKFLELYFIFQIETYQTCNNKKRSISVRYEDTNYVN